MIRVWKQRWNGFELDERASHRRWSAGILLECELGEMSVFAPQHSCSPEMLFRTARGRNRSEISVK